jgi:hypothetical protein
MGATVTAAYLTEIAGVQGQPDAAAPNRGRRPRPGPADVDATLSLTLGSPASFGAFMPSVARTYTPQTTATVISTAGDAALAVTLSTTAP